MFVVLAVQAQVLRRTQEAEDGRTA
jgi:hypothetical protein